MKWHRFGVVAALLVLAGPLTAQPASAGGRRPRVSAPKKKRGGTKNKDPKKSPASREISSAEYDLKNLRRRFKSDNWKKSANTRKSARKVIKNVRDAFANVQKKDRSWDVRKQLAELKKYDRLVNAADKASGGSSKAPPKGSSKADTMDVSKHPEQPTISSARFTLKSLRKRIASKKYEKDDRVRRDMDFDFRQLDKRFAKIAKADRKFPLAAWKKELAKFKSLVKGANAKNAEHHQAINDALKLRIEYGNIADRNLALNFLYDVSKGKYRTGGYEWMRQKVDDVAEFSNGFAAKCKARGYEAIPQSKFRKERNYPKVTCKLARDYKALALKYVDKNAKAEVVSLVKKQKSAIKALGNSGSIKPSNYTMLSAPKKAIDRQFKRYQSYYAMFGGTAKRNTWAPIGAQKAAFDAALKSAAKKGRFPKDARFGEASMGPAASQKLKGARLLAAKSIHSSWRIKKNSIGVPLSKNKWGFIMTKAKGESFCRVNQGEVRATYQGGGRYTRPVWKFHNNHFIVSACR